MSYLPYFCLFPNSGVQHILCCAFVLFSSSCVPVSLQCPFLIGCSVFSNVYLKSITWLCFFYDVFFFCT